MARVLWPDAEAAGVTRKTFDANLKGLKLDWSLPQIVLPDPAYPEGPALPGPLKPKPRHQAEFDIPELYFSKGALNALAATGRGKYQQLGQTLGAIQQKYNVPASIVVAIWGRETGFGAVGASLRRHFGDRHASLHGPQAGRIPPAARPGAQNA